MTASNNEFLELQHKTKTYDANLHLLRTSFYQ